MEIGAFQHALNAKEQFFTANDKGTASRGASDVLVASGYRDNRAGMGLLLAEKIEQRALFRFGRFLLCFLRRGCRPRPFRRLLDQLFAAALTVGQTENRCFTLQISRLVERLFDNRHRLKMP